MNISVIFQNKDYLAVNKPTDLSIHNAEDTQNLLDLLSAQLKISKLFPVHRLDKETSGIQVLALNAEAAKTLAEEFQNRSVEKIYQGILRGTLKSADGVWKQPLTDKSEGRKNPAGISKDRVPCETKFHVVKSNRYFTWCEFNLVTGRQHQIRKHTAMAGHHLLGDPRYGDDKYNQRMAQIYKTDRMFLHCSKLTIQSETIECPPPEEFEKLFNES